MGALRHACSCTGCPAIIPGDQRYCEKHRGEYGRSRGSAHARGYTRDWQRESAAFLREHPLCECDECKKLGRVRPSQVTDHIIPHKGDPKLFWDRSNWQAMSKPCHDRKTATEDGGFGHG
jgi:5-methylcytosine-specific restriction protein A